MLTVVTVLAVVAAVVVSVTVSGHDSVDATTADGPAPEVDDGPPTSFEKAA